MNNYVVIGKLIENNTRGTNKITAYKLYEIETNKRYLSSRENISKAIQNGANIIGLKINYMATKSGGRTPVLQEDRTFGTAGINIVDGEGHQIGSPNKQVLFEIEGFGEFKKYKFVDSAGCVGHYTYDEVLQLAKEKITVGCSIRKGSLYVSQHVKHGAQEC